MAMAERNPVLMATDWGREIVETSAPGTVESMIAGYELWMSRINAVDDPLKGTDFAASMWQEVTAAAERHNAPGAFSALIGFEWTSTPDGNNLHRNIIFRNGKEIADRLVPISAYDTDDPERLWDWMQMVERDTGARLLAIPHNGNLSNGLMFDDVTLTDKRPLDRAYAERRMRWEPVYEVTQIKGDGETHPLLSPEDEFADFETWDKGSFGPQAKAPDMLPREYAREAYKRGLAYEAELGANPFKFGMVGSTDAHTGLSTTTEDNFFGKVTAVEPTADPIRFYEAITGRFGGEELRQYHWQGSAAGLAAVWARENTREAIWDALARKEVFATTGTRLRVRVFAGWNFTAGDLDRSDFAKHGYDNGVPMGGDLSGAPEGKAPTFLIRALRDVDGANLDRTQVIKGWLEGERRERGEGLRRRLVRRPRAGARRQASAGRRHGERRGGDLHQRDRRAVPAGVLDRLGFRSGRARFLLRAGAGNSYPALDHLRRQDLRRRASRGCSREHPRACLHLADLVHAGGMNQARRRT
jgi:hypothetical protein